MVDLCFPTWARCLIVSPTQPSLRPQAAIMITCSNSPVQGSEIPNHYVGNLLHTTAISGRSHAKGGTTHSSKNSVRIQYRCSARFRAIATFTIFVRAAWQGERTCCATAVDCAPPLEPPRHAESEAASCLLADMSQRTVVFWETMQRDSFRRTLPS